jgi:hypothetical protein
MHDANDDNTCEDCMKASCNQGYSHNGDDLCSTAQHSTGTCGKITDYCPASASISAGNVHVSARTVGATATVTCNDPKQATGKMEFTCQTNGASGKWVNTGSADCDVPSLQYTGWTTWSQCQNNYATQNSRMNSACSNSWPGARAMSFNEHLLNPSGMPSKNPTNRWLTFTTQGMEGKGGWSGGSGNWWTNCHNNHNCLNCYNPHSPYMHSGHPDKKNLCHTSGRGEEHPSYKGKCTDIGGCWCNTRAVMCVKAGRRRLVEADMREEEDKEDYGPVNLSE